MKFLSIKILMAGVLFFLATFSHAQILSGWQTYVTASNGSATTTMSVFEASEPLCTAARSNAIINLIAMGYTTIIAAPPCTPTNWFVPKKIWERIPDPFEIPRGWPPGPVCLSCPYLNKTILELIYPERFEKALEIVERYNIEGYTKELMELQEAYELESFEKEMFQFEMDQLNPRKR